MPMTDPAKISAVALILRDAAAVVNGFGVSSKDIKALRRGVHGGAAQDAVEEGSERSREDV